MVCHDGGKTWTGSFGNGVVTPLVRAGVLGYLSHGVVPASLLL